MMKLWILLILLSAAQAPQVSHLIKPDCIERHTTTRLNTLEIRTCLYGYAATDQAPARAVEIRQTLTNVSAKPIELLLSQDPLRRFAPFILDESKRRHLQKRPRVPSSEDDAFVEPANEYLRLKPRASTELNYRLVDMMIELPGASGRYFIGARANFDFRREGERLSDNEITRARFDEEAAADRRIRPAYFSGVGISVD